MLDYTARSSVSRFRHASGWSLPVRELCYDCGVELLADECEDVRWAAVRLVGLCGKMFSISEDAKMSQGKVDAIFVQLSSMARDMSLNVRTEVFEALAGMRTVSESILLQSLYKKGLGEKGSVNMKYKLYKTSSSAFGILLHGIEDEFCEVRIAACKCMGALAKLSVQFSEKAFSMLMDMTNDDSEGVRLQTLQSLHIMAARGCLTLQEEHLHMFLGLLHDSSAPIRSLTRRVLEQVKLPKHKLLKSVLDALVTTLEAYEEEEEDIYSLLFSIGKKHKSFSAKVARLLAGQIGALCSSELTLDSHRTKAMILLSLPAALFDNNSLSGLSQFIFSYGVTLMGRFPNAFGGLSDKEDLMELLYHASGIPLLHNASISKRSSPCSSVAADSGEESTYLCDKRLLDIPKINLEKETKREETVSIETLECEEIIEDEGTGAFEECVQVCKTLSEVSTSESQTCYELLTDKVAAYHLLERSGKNDRNSNIEVTKLVKNILNMVEEAFPLAKMERVVEFQIMLRFCVEELKSIYKHCSVDAVSLVGFAMLYVQCIYTIVDLMDKFKLRGPHTVSICAVDHSLEKLKMSLRRLKYCFRELPREADYLLKELTLLDILLRLTYCRISTDLALKSIRSIILHFESSLAESELTNFIKELKGSIASVCTNDVFDESVQAKLYESFQLQPINTSGKFKALIAELKVLENDSENPSYFVSGLPVGVRYHVKLYNVSSLDKIWLRMVLGESISHFFLDLSEFEGSYEVQSCSGVFPFYATPNASSFVLHCFLVMECPSEVQAALPSQFGGPEGEAVIMCEECVVYFDKVGKEGYIN